MVEANHLRPVMHPCTCTSFVISTCSQMINQIRATQESKDQSAELNCRLEALKVEVMGEGHQRSGNSLFGEVDNRRMEIERKLISLKVRHEMLEKTHATTQHQLKKMKVLVVSL